MSNDKLKEALENSVIKQPIISGDVNSADGELSDDDLDDVAGGLAKSGCTAMCNSFL
jgi:hypothetical protein